MFGPAPVATSTIHTHLDASWNLRIAGVEYAPIGYGSFHWYVSEVGGDRWLATLDQVDERPVAAAYEIAGKLAEEFSFVRGPQPGHGGRVAVDIGGWWLTLWAWVEGDSEEWNDAEPQRSLLSGHLRSLHDYRGVAQQSELTEDWQVTGRTRLTELLAGAGDNRGPYAGETGRRIRANRALVLSWLDHYDRLVGHVAGEAEFVITHGEPHARNVVRNREGLRLIDWDTVRWAPRERDLWDLGPEVMWRDDYGRDVLLSPEAMELYRLQWTLVELADFLPGLLAAEETTPDLDIAMREIRSYLPHT
ncbi:MAG: phosphotransferase [Acidimicrobiia bacterium]|nr:phosphotransferase [Acidimicrobiia bacterium]